MVTQAENRPSPDIPVPFKDRFALQTRDVVLIGVVMLLIGAWVIVRGHQTSAGLLGRPLRVGIVSWPGYAGGLVANNGLRASKDSDFWRNHKLLVEFILIPDEAQLRRAFARGGEKGGVDVMWSTVDSLAQLLPALAKQGNQPRAFMQVDWSRGADTIISSAGIKCIEDLRGKRVAVSLAASQWLLEYSLENSSLTNVEKMEIRSQRLTTKGSQETRDLFVNGNVDAAVLWEPDATEAINRRSGANRLIDTSTAANLIADVMVAKGEFIHQHPEVIAAFIRGWLLDGTTKAASNPMLAVKILQEEPDFEILGEETTRKLLGKVELATLDDNTRMFGLADGEPLFEPLFDEASHLWAKHGYITAPMPAEQAQDIRSLQEIYQAELGSMAARRSCDSERMTKELSIAFPPGRAELSSEAQHTLDNEISLLLRTLTEFRFCVEAVTTEGNDPRGDLSLRKKREAEVIQHLVERYNLPRSQFVSVSVGASGTATDGKAAQYIRLKLVNSGGP
jgi:NitT/TauT family transport system substrate-binding protein